MYCTKCGRELPPNGVCSCQSQTQTPPGGGFRYQGPAGSGYSANGGGYQAPPTGRGGMPPLVAAIRRFNGGTFALALAIVYSLTLLLTVVKSVGSATFLLSSLRGAAPQILVCVGMWMLYASAKGKFSVTGYTLANIGLIIRLVLTILGYVICILATLLVFIGMGQMFDSGSFYTGTMIAMIVVFLLLGALTVVYLLKVRKVVTTSRDVLLGQGRAVEVSLYPIVILGLSAFGKLILLLFLRLISSSLGWILWQLSSELSYVMGSSSSTALMSQAYSALGLGSGFLSIATSLLDVAMAVLFLVALVLYRGLRQTPTVGKPNSEPVVGFQGTQPNQFDQF